MGTENPSLGNFPLAPRTNLQPSSPPMSATYPAGTLQSAFPWYPSEQPNAAVQIPPVNYLIASPPQQGGYGAALPATSSPYLPQRGRYIQSPPVAAPGMLYSRGHLQHPGSMLSTGTTQDLVEEFNSLSLASGQGSSYVGLDSKALPRPLDGDVEPKSFAKMYPMNSSSRYMRLTCAMPNSHSLSSRWHLPLGAVVCPLAEGPEGEEVPVVNGTACCIRCLRCKAFLNPYVEFEDCRRLWRCNLCKSINKVPSEYFANLNAQNKRVDLDHQPELSNGSVEFIDSSKNVGNPPTYVFLIDVSVSSVRSGMLEVVAETIRSNLNKLPGFPRTQIGFITFDSTVHFYNLKSSLRQPQMMVVSDLDDMFMPLPDNLLVNLSESIAVVDSLLESLPTMFKDYADVESALGPALQAASLLMGKLGGKLLIFQTTLPSLGAGCLKIRGDNPHVYGTDKEHTLRKPKDSYYKQLAAEFSKCNISVNVYAISDKYLDIASLGTLAKYTGGQVNYYSNFISSAHTDRLRYELARDLTRETAWEAVMRIRCGKGVHVTNYHGNHMMKRTDLMGLPAVDYDKAYAIQFGLEETLLTTDTIYFQISLLHPTSSGERRFRVHNVAVPVVANLGEMYRLADTGAIVSLLSRLAIEESLSSKLEEGQKYLQLRIVKALKEYRDLYAVHHHLGGRIIYPESLRLLLLYALALYKSTPLRHGYTNIELDECCAVGCTMMTLPVKKLLKLLYPNLVRVDEYLSKTSLADEYEKIWKRLPFAAENLDSRGL